VQAAPPTATTVAPKPLEVMDVSVSFGGVKAVRNVSFQVRPGEIHGLIGPNGAGKTTLIDAITGFAPVRSGAVTLAGQDITRWSPSRRSAAGLSRSFQSLELFDDLTIEENIAVACDRRGRLHYLTDLVHPGAISLTAAGQAAVSGFRLAPLLPATPGSVSFGQRKLVAIARCVASGPSILLLDEPAAGLDDAEAAELAALIRRLAADWGIGLLLVEHKVDMILSICDRVTVLQNGRVLASGTPDQVRSHPEVIDAYLGVGVRTVQERT
jgi:sulfate-transporting ATPase